MYTYRSDRWFAFINNAVICLISLTMISPLLHLASLSLSSPYYANANLVSFVPRGFNLDVYKTIFGMGALWHSLAVTIYITIAGTLVTLFLTSTMAYGLSRPAMPWRKFITKATIVSFIFSIPMIPGYLVVKATGIENTLWALIIPGSLGTFNLLIMKSFFQGISASMFDAAKIDGCNELSIFYRIAIPLSLPVFATIAVFQAVIQWNSYFNAVIFIRSHELFPLQILLRNLVVEVDDAGSRGLEASNVTAPETMKAGIILFATIPILIVYPFLQKYFVKGAMLGAIKE